MIQKLIRAYHHHCRPAESRRASPPGPDRRCGRHVLVRAAATRLLLRPGEASVRPRSIHAPGGRPMRASDVGSGDARNQALCRARSGVSGTSKWRREHLVVDIACRARRRRQPRHPTRQTERLASSSMRRGHVSDARRTSPSETRLTAPHSKRLRKRRPCVGTRRGWSRAHALPMQTPGRRAWPRGCSSSDAGVFLAPAATPARRAKPVVRRLRRAPLPSVQRRHDHGRS